MPKPVYLLTVQEAHKEYNSLTDKIWAKYKQLDSGEYGSVHTPAFKAEACVDTPSPKCHGIRSLLIVLFYQSSEWSPMGLKGTGPKFVTRPVCVSS